MPLVPRLVLALLPAALLAACSLAPSYAPPTATTPASFREGGQWQPASGRAVDPGRWWQAFGDPLLDELQQHLAIDNQNIRQAEANYRAARAAVDSAAAPLYPNLGLDAAATRGASTTTSGNSRVANSFSLSAQAAWEIDLWGSVRNGVAAASADAEASAATLGAARLSAQALLAQAYFALRTADAQQALYTRTVDAYRNFLKLTENRRAQGVASSLDVERARAQLATAGTQLADASLQRAQNEHAIAVLIGRAPAALSIDPAGRLPELPPTPALVPSTVLETRYDIHAAERQVAAANARIGVARAAWFPSLSLGASGGVKNSDLSSLFDAPSRIWSLGPSLALSLFDGGSRAAARATAGANYDAAVAGYRQTVLTAFQEVEDNLAAARWLGDEARTQATAVAAARRAREVAENQYRAGIVGTLDVITAQASELSAESAALSIWNRRMDAAVLLYKNLGGRDLAPDNAS